MGDYSEDWLEQAHQTGDREENRTNNTSSRAEAARLHSNWEYKRNYPSVIAAKAAVNQTYLRKKRSNDSDGLARHILVETHSRMEKKIRVAETKESIRNDALRKAALLLDNDIHLK